MAGLWRPLPPATRVHHGPRGPTHPRFTELGAAILEGVLLHPSASSTPPIPPQAGRPTEPVEDGAGVPWPGPQGAPRVQGDRRKTRPGSTLRSNCHKGEASHVLLGTEEATRILRFSGKVFWTGS